MAGDCGENIAERLDRLERENRWWKRVVIVILVIVGSVGLMGQTPSGRRVVEAERFVLKDADGRIRGVLGSEYPGLLPESSLPGQVGLHLYSSSGDYVAGLAESHDGVGA